MGWCSGTEIFDTMCDVLIAEKHVDKKVILKSLIEIMWKHDWDCEYDSDYINNDVVRECFIELDGEWVQRFKDND